MKKQRDKIISSSIPKHPLLKKGNKMKIMDFIFERLNENPGLEILSTLSGGCEKCEIEGISEIDLWVKPNDRIRFLQYLNQVTGEMFGIEEDEIFVNIYLYDCINEKGDKIKAELEKIENATVAIQSLNADDNEDKHDDGIETVSDAPVCNEEVPLYITISGCKHCSEVIPEYEEQFAKVISVVLSITTF